jgi:predicted NBD/HSP70 family sugar kinase
MIVAIDTGATKTLVTSFGKDGKMGEQIKFETPKKPTEYVTTLEDTLGKLSEGKKVDIIVVAFPGVIKNGVFILNANLPEWVDFNIESALAKIFGNTKVLIQNDAKLAALGETRQLVKVPPQVLFVTISTGIGSGIVTDGKINYGLRNSEAGHALIEYDGVVREWESFASGKAIYNAYGKYAHDIKNKRIWNQIADRISRGFLAVIPILQPDIIIIGGSMGTYFERYGEHLQNILKEKLPKGIPCPKIVQAKHPELAVIYGCYFYALDNFTSKIS